MEEPFINRVPTNCFYNEENVRAGSKYVPLSIEELFKVK